MQHFAKTTNKIRLHIGSINDYGDEEKSGWNEIATCFFYLQIIDGQIENIIKKIQMINNSDEVDDKYRSGFKFIELYLLGSENPVSCDKRGNSLIAIPADTVLYALKYDNSKEPYYRFALAIELIESIMKNMKEEIHCIFYMD
jgi:hypothetical protein